MLTAQQLESGDEEVTGSLGDGEGTWTLFVSAEHSIQVMSLLLNEDGNLTNLSRTPYEPHAFSTDCNDELVVEGNDSGHGTLDTAVSLGNLTETAAVRARAGTVNSVSNENGYYGFTLDDTRTMRFELRNLTGNADLYLRNSLGEEVHWRANSTNGGLLDESIVWTLDAGTYYIRVESATTSTSDTSYEFRHSNDSVVPGRRPSSAFDLGDLTDVAVVRTLTARTNGTRNETCLFHRAYYGFTLDDTRTMRFELRSLTGNADLYLRNSLGEEFHWRANSTNDGLLDESIVWTLDAGTYYILVETATTSTSDISYELRHSNDSVVPGRRPSSAFDLGDLTDVAVVRTRDGRINGTRNETCCFHRAYYGFTLDDTRTMRFELRSLTGNADLYLRNSLGEEVHWRADSTNDGLLDESIVWTFDAGAYYIQVETATTSTSDIGYELRYGPES